MRRGVRTLVAGVCLVGMLAGVPAVQTGGTIVAAASTPIFLEWMRVAPNRPRTIWVGGEAGCQNATSDDDESCPGWAMRSLDGGTTWRDVSAGLAAADAPYSSGGIGGCSYTRAPAVIDPTGMQIAIEEDGSCTTASSTYAIVLYSRDAGAHWIAVTTATEDGGYGAGASAPAFSSVPPYTLWTIDTSSDNDTHDAAWLKNRSLHDGTNPSSVRAGSSYDDSILSLVPDPRSATGVFANAESYVNQADYVAFSARGGAHWQRVAAPPRVKNFSVAQDPAMAGGLIATTHDKRFPADRRWYSVTGGATWTMGVCAGDYHGTCPLATLASTSPSTPSWAFNRAGVWTYPGHAATDGKASVRLPVMPALVLDARGSLGASLPLYILSKATRGARHGSLYRSINGGRTWTHITLPAPVLK